MSMRMSMPRAVGMLMFVLVKDDFQAPPERLGDPA